MSPTHIQTHRAAAAIRASFGLSLAVGIAACSGRPQSPRQSDAVERRATRLAAASREFEPVASERLRTLVTSAHAALAGEENRLKKHSSLVRKISARLAADASLTAETVEIVDALRYTVVITDSPAGNYVEVAAKTLKALEAAGSEVVRVKNYWPRGDNYSGVNVVLRESSGFLWEVQFHTPASLAVRDQWHGHYSILRDEALDPKRRRAIFDEMSPPWNEVAIPAGVLEVGKLHATERIVVYPRP